MTHLHWRAMMMRLRVMTESCPLTSKMTSSPLACDDDASSCDEESCPLTSDDDTSPLAPMDDDHHPMSTDTFLHTKTHHHPRQWRCASSCQRTRSSHHEDDIISIGNGDVSSSMS